MELKKMKIFSSKNRNPINDTAIFACVLFAIFVSYFYLSLRYSPSSDYSAFITGAKIVKDGLASELYDVATQVSYQETIVKFSQMKLLPFRYLSIVACVFLPLSYLDNSMGYSVFLVLNFMILTAICFFVSKFILRVHFIFIFVYALSLSPVFISLVQGQTSMILAIISIVIYYLLFNKKDGLAGIATAFLFFKPQYFLIFPFLFILSRKKKRFLAGFSLSVLVVILLSILIQGWQSLLSFPQFLTITEGAEYGSRYWHMVTIVGFLRSLNLENDFSLIVNLSLYVFSIYLFIKSYEVAKFNTYFSIAMILAVIFSIHSLQHDLVILAIPLAFWIKNLLSRKKFVLVIIPIVVLFLASSLANHSWISLALVGLVAALLKHKVQV